MQDYRTVFKSSGKQKIKVKNSEHENGPFDDFQVKFVAEKIALPEPEVEKKLSQMILDHKIQGILDQETRVLIIFAKSERDETYDDALETISAMSKVVDRLYQAAQKLT